MGSDFHEQAAKSPSFLCNHSEISQIRIEMFLLPVYF